MVNSFVQSAVQRRPQAKQSYREGQTYVEAELSNVKIAQPQKAWTVNVQGAMQTLSATLYFNVGLSVQSPAMEPAFQYGDLIVEEGRTYVVQGVVHQWFKGHLHHYEVALV